MTGSSAAPTAIVDDAVKIVHSHRENVASRASRSRLGHVGNLDNIHAHPLCWRIDWGQFPALAMCSGDRRIRVKEPSCRGCSSVL